ncbi:uncharacterized protein LOC126560101 [Anopheles maculipalpis]|uniref:uncharacterized protein LOC126560101 n=1 Tax=Anopheles maculipalpis TaxID=1496333 RepID=UPI00215998D8|nr:uncharacterized protein LOC126560101 [Anopheles maculipalpis]
MVLLRALHYGFRFLQENFNVGHHLEHFCLLRCVDIVSPAMLIHRPRSGVEIGIKTLGLSVMLTHMVGLMYDFTQQDDIRVSMDIFCMLSLFTSLFARHLCLRQYQSHINALERLDKDPTFERDLPYAVTIRHRTVMQNNRYIGSYLASHLLFVIVYVVQNMVTEDSFVKIITHFPIDLSEYAPILDTLAQLCYSLIGFGWAWYHACGQITIIVLVRFAITEFQVFLHSLATFDDQIHERLLLETDGNVERVLRELLYKHARQHSHLIVVLMHLRTILRAYSLVHFAFYLNMMAAFLARVYVIPGSSSLGMAIPLLVTMVFFVETFGLCMLVEELVQLNRKVAFNLYGFSWTRYLHYGHTIKRTMMLMIMQATNTKDFSAGGLTTVSAELFAKTCRLVYTMMMAMANLAS